MSNVIFALRLDPCSPAWMVVSCGASYEEVRDWYISNYTMDDDWVKSMAVIKRHHNQKTTYLDFLEKYKDAFEECRLGGDTSGTLLYKQPDECFCMILKEGFNPKNPNNMITLAHEVLHLCQLFLPNYLTSRDVELEGEAYFHSYIMREIIKFF